MQSEEECGGSSGKTHFCEANALPKGVAQFSITDALVSGVFEVQKPLAVCNPAEKQPPGSPAEPPVEADVHLVSYRVKDLFAGLYDEAEFKALKQARFLTRRLLATTQGPLIAIKLTHLRRIGERPIDELHVIPLEDL